MNCDNCKYEIKENEKFCSNCGNLLLTQQNEYLYFEKQQKYSRNVLMFEFIFFVLNLCTILSMPVVILSSILGMIFSIQGIVNASKIIKISKNPLIMSIIGLILSILNIIIYAVITVVFMIFFIFIYVLA